MFRNILIGKNIYINFILYNGDNFFDEQWFKIKVINMYDKLCIHTLSRRIIIMLTKQEVTYINTNSKIAISEFSTAFYKTLKNIYNKEKKIVMLCIGTDRVTGDSLGPIIGYKLSRYTPNGIVIYGTLDNPVHAKNLEETINEIYSSHKNPLIIAIDASLGKTESVGYLTVGKGHLRPGAGVNKHLPEVGDMFITGIVNINGMLGTISIQNTRLSIVMKMADIAYYGILNGIGRVFNKIAV